MTPQFQNLQSLGKMSDDDRDGSQKVGLLAAQPRGVAAGPKIFFSIQLP